MTRDPPCSPRHFPAFIPAWYLVGLALLINPVDAAQSPGPRPAAGEAIAVLAGGCFWGVEGVFEHLLGVRSATSGYARYQHPTAGAGPVTPVEAVRVVYDPSQISFTQLLEVFFTVAHDPTSRDRQGPDTGPEYRAVVFFTADPERAEAERHVAELTRARRFSAPIVTEVRALAGFDVAEALHQDYGAKHPTDSYVVRNDAPKLLQLKQAFPALYQAQRVP